MDNVSARIRELKGVYTGKRCFVLGNGPSLNYTDLELLKNEYVWGFNKIYLLFERISWRPKFYVANDPRLTGHISEEIDMLVGQLPESLFFFPLNFRSNHVSSAEMNTYWYNEIPWRTDKNIRQFSLDPAVYLVNSATVTIAGLQLAAYMGFNPIYLVGCDTYYSVPSSVSHENDDPELLISNEDDDPNHFSPKYSGKGDKWTTPNVKLMIKQYGDACAVLEKRGITVYNATIGGQLEVFQRINFDALFGEFG